MTGAVPPVDEGMNQQGQLLPYYGTLGNHQGHILERMLDPDQKRPAAGE